MDAQRADGQRWYDDGPFGDAAGRYGSLNDERYSQREGFNPYGDNQYEDPSDQQPYPSGERRSRTRRATRSGAAVPEAPGQYDERGFADSPDYAESPDYADSQFSDQQYQQAHYPNAQYGDFPDAVADDPVRLSARDRQQLRERAAQTSGQPLASALQSPPITAPVVPPGMPNSGVPQVALQAPTEAIPTGVRVAPPSTYRSRRPGLAVLLTLAAVVTELILLKVLLANVTHSGAAAVSGTLGALFALAGTPATIVGLYALATGAASAGGPQPGRAWLRTPLAYLPIGLILIVAAGLAA